MKGKKIGRIRIPERRYPTGAESTELLDLYHLARVAGSKTRHERMLWVTNQFVRRHPNWTKPSAYIALDEALQHPLVNPFPIADRRKERIKSVLRTYRTGDIITPAQELALLRRDFREGALTESGYRRATIEVLSRKNSANPFLETAWAGLATGAGIGAGYTLASYGLRRASKGKIKRNPAPTSYKGEFFAQPGPHAFEGMLAFKGKPKIYRMAYLQGFPHIEVESYPGEGVRVSYLITGQTYSWYWKYRNEAWDWARTRSLHVQMLRNPKKKLSAYERHIRSLVKERDEEREEILKRLQRMRRLPIPQNPTIQQFGNPLKHFRCSICGASAPSWTLTHGNFDHRMRWLRRHYKVKHPGKWGKGRS